MFMKVDLPEPDGPITATNSPAVDRQRHAGERVHDVVAEDVVLAQVVGLDQRRSLCPSAFARRKFDWLCQRTSSIESRESRFSLSRR